jgi:hypothetical protein
MARVGHAKQLVDRHEPEEGNGAEPRRELDRGQQGPRRHGRSPVRPRHAIARRAAVVTYGSSGVFFFYPA